MKTLSYALGFLILMSATAGAVEYHIYRDYSGKLVITNLQPPSSARIVLTYELADSPSLGPGVTILPPTVPETKESDKVADIPAVVTQGIDAQAVETPVESRDVIIVVPSQQRDRRPDHRRGHRRDGFHDRR